MAAHWKHGDGFLIRYGGYRDIQWFFDGDFARKASGLSLPPIHPVALIIEAAKVPALYLQWWELRKQTLLHSAQFEERRITWLADILAEWHAELRDGIVRLDTIRYLDRELSRFYEKLSANAVIDAPSSLLLQIERSAATLCQLNTMLDGLRRDFTMPGLHLPEPFRYVPYHQLKDPKAFEHYIEAANIVIDGATQVASAAVAGEDVAAMGGFGLLASFAAAGVLFPMAIGFAPAILWTARQFLEGRRKLASQDRMSHFAAIAMLTIETRSAHALINLVQQQPSTTLSFELKDGNLVDVAAGGP